MHLKPILAALKRNRAGAILITLQIAMTLAIVCNALFIIHERLSYLSRPSGLNEHDLFVMSNQWVGHGNNDAALLQADLTTIRSTPGVVDAADVNSYPLRGGGWSTGIGLTPDQIKSTADSALYFSDQHAIAAFGLKLIAGRNFRADEVGDMTLRTPKSPPSIIVTRALARKLFPGGSALGKSVYVSGLKVPTEIVGIVQRLQTPWTDSSWADGFSENSVLVPFHLIAPGTNFVVRTGAYDAQVIKTVRERLFARNRMRVITHTRSFAQVRAHAYRSDRGLAILMAVVCLGLLLVTAAGIVGLASFWVAQRRRHIGIRRALGATRGDILRYFQTENLLISGAGSLLGISAAVGINLWMVTHYEMHRMAIPFVLFGVMVVIGLGQLSVLAPALWASRVPPVVATRAQ